MTGLQIAAIVLGAAVPLSAIGIVLFKGRAGGKTNYSPAVIYTYVNPETGDQYSTTNVDEANRYALAHPQTIKFAGHTPTQDEIDAKLKALGYT